MKESHLMYELGFYIYRYLSTLKNFVRISSWEGDAMMASCLGWGYCNNDIEKLLTSFYSLLSADILTTRELLPTKLELIYLLIFSEMNSNSKRLCF